MRESLVVRGFRRVLILISHLLSPLFFSRRYLTGRHFSFWGRGWMWAWRSIWTQKVLGVNRLARWPTAPDVRILNPDNLEFDPNDLNNFQTFGCYYQNLRAKIVLERGVYVGPNVGFITENHDPEDLDRHRPAEPIRIGAGSWIGMNAVILPGVHLGPRSIVGAGAVVTKSFPGGNCILAGVPARVVGSAAGDDPAHPHDLATAQRGP